MALTKENCARHTGMSVAGIHLAENAMSTFCAHFEHRFRLQTCRNDGNLA